MRSVHTVEEYMNLVGVTCTASPSGKLALLSNLLTRDLDTAECKIITSTSSVLRGRLRQPT